VATVLLAGVSIASPPGRALEFAIAFPEAVASESIDGRVILLLSTSDETEPRFQVRAGVKAVQLFGVDVEGLAPDEPAVVDAAVFGYPVRSIEQLPPGDYQVQAVLHRYETFERADGHLVKLPMDRGEGQHWNRAPGNLYSTPRRIEIDPAVAERISIRLDQVIPPIEKPADTKYIKHFQIQSQKLTEFWGRPMFLGAHVLLPEGFDEHPEARYPLMIFHGHPSRRTPISSASTASGSGLTATTGSSSRRPTTSTAPGPVPTFPASSSSRSNTPTPTTTTPTR
jgi:hypothetical protein